MTDDDAVDTGHQEDRHDEEVTGQGAHLASPASALCRANAGRALIAALANRVLAPICNAIN